MTTERYFLLIELYKVCVKRVDQLKKSWDYFHRVKKSQKCDFVLIHTWNGNIYYSFAWFSTSLMLQHLLIQLIKLVIELSSDWTVVHHTLGRMKYHCEDYQDEAPQLRHCEGFASVLEYWFEGFISVLLNFSHYFYWKVQLEKLKSFPRPKVTLFTLPVHLRCGYIF